MTEHTDVPSGPPREVLRRWVGSQAGALQAGYRQDAAWAVARLAGLRASTIEAPTIWEVLGSLPPDLVGSGDAPSRGEASAGHALRLFAHHQQSRRDRAMHQNGVRLGLGLRRLSAGPEPESALARRFQVMSQATRFEACLHHLGGLIQQLRAAGVGIDYGLLAVDLWDYQHPTSRSTVRLRWNRDFYTHRPPTSDDTASEAHETTGDNS